MQESFTIKADISEGTVITLQKDLNDEEYDTLFEILANPTCPEKVKVEFCSKHKDEINANELNRWIEFLKSGKAPSCLTLNFIASLYFDLNEEIEASMKSLALVLTHPNCPSHLHLDLSECRVEIAPFVEALRSGKCPPYISLSFRGGDCTIVDDDALSLLSALEDERCPSHLTLDLMGNEFSSDTIIAITKTLMSGKCAQNLHLKFGLRSELNDEAWNAVTEILKREGVPSLTLQLFGLEPDQSQSLASALTRSKRSTPLSLIITDCFSDPFFGLLNNPDCVGNLTLFFYEPFAPEDVTILKNNLSPKNLGFELPYLRMKMTELPEMVEQFKEVMQYNTSITTLKFRSNSDFEVDAAKNPSLGKQWTELQKYIDLCCLRNQLMYKHPELAEYIKRVSSEAGYYVPNYRPQFVPSLTLLAGQACIFNKKSSTPTTSPEIQAYLEVLNNIKNQFPLNIDSVLGKRKRGNGIS